MEDLATVRERFAEDLRYKANLHCSALIRAFAEVERERFLGPGPWHIYNVFDSSYWQTPDADPRHIYHDVLVGIDPDRLLNNGQPSGLAFLIEALELEAGARVVHLGCGTGYYSAIMASVVSETGRVIAVELDAKLADRAIANLRSLKQVTAVAADASSYHFEDADAILINAGATHIIPLWLDALRPAGRLLLLPLTMDNGSGGVLKIVRREHGFSARFIMGILIFKCAGAREQQEEERLQKAFLAGDSNLVRSLRTRPHEIEAPCWLHSDDFCLSKIDEAT